VPSQAVEQQESGGGGNGAVPARLTLLFVLSTTAAGQAVEGVLQALLARGHALFVALEGPRADSADVLARLASLQTEHAGLQYRLLPESRHLWLYPATAVRRRLDHLRSLEPGLDAVSPFGDRPPPIFRLLLFLPPFRWQSGRRALTWLLTRLEAAMPIRGSVRELIREHAPDRVLVSPLVDFGSPQVDYLRTAHAAGTPSVFVVAARDDLTTKGGIRELPTFTLAWDEAQAQAAVRVQGVPSERVTPAGIGGDGSVASGAAEAVERVTEADVVKSRRGLLLRPLLWLLTPILAILMPLLRPRATARAVVKGVRRQTKRIRAARQRHRRAAKLKAYETKQRKRAEEIAAKQETKAQAEAAKRAEKERAEAKKLAEKERHEEMKRAEKERADAAKLAEKERHEEMKRAEKERADAAKRVDKERAEAMKLTEKQRAEAAKTGGNAAAPVAAEQTSEAPTAKAGKPAKRERAAAKAAKKDAKAGPGGRRVARMRKRARGRVKAMRRRWKYTRRGVRRVYNRRWRLTYGSTINRVPARDELPALLNARNLLGRGVEIGVKTGVYSDELLSNWHGQELVSIDPWLSADPDEYVDRSNVSQDEFEQYYQQTRERLGKHGSRSTIWRLTSVEAAPKIPDHELDFVYIDARHDYDSVLEDLEAWCAKVKPGGILAGHDYVDGDLPQGEFYVKSAVDEFFGARGIHVHSTEGPSVVEMFPTWIVEVPEGGVAPTKRSESGEEGDPSPPPVSIRTGDE
jgi:hypothetical protein